MRRGVGLWLVALLLAAVAAHTLYWRTVSQRLAGGFAGWAAERRTHGWAVRVGTPETGGWPLAARLVVPGLALEGARADLPGGLAWSAERVVLSIRLLDPGTLAVAAEGAQHLRLGDLPDVPYTADRIAAAVPLESGVPVHAATVLGSNIRAGVPAKETTGRDVTGGLTIGVLEGHGESRPGAPQGEPALAFTLSAEAIGLPAGLPANVTAALGRRISSLSLEGAVSGPVPRVRGIVPRATAWRDGGGVLQVERLALGWGVLGFSGSATFALDARLQPMGAGNARIVGYAEALDALAAGGAIPRGGAVAAKALATLIAHAPEGGGPSEIEVPFTLQDRVLAVRQLPLARLPELVLPTE